MPVYRRFALSAPRVPTFVVSLILAIVALATHFTRVPWASEGQNRFWLMAIAYALLMLGALLRGV